MYGEDWGKAAEGKGTGALGSPGDTPLPFQTALKAQLPVFPDSFISMQNASSGPTSPFLHCPQRQAECMAVEDTAVGGVGNSGVARLSPPPLGYFPVEKGPLGHTQRMLSCTNKIFSAGVSDIFPSTETLL